MSTFRTSDGVALRYEVVGDAALTVFVCQGGPNNICDTIMRDVGPLGGACRLVFHDYRGSGQSASAEPSSYRFDQLADDLEELRVYLDVPTISVLGHSMGGFVSLAYALRHGDALDRMVLVGTTPCGAVGPMILPTVRALGPVRTAKGLAMPLRYLALWSWRPASDARTTALYAPVAVTQEPRRKLRDVVAQAHPELPVENDNAPHLMKALGRVDFRPLVRNITCPILVLYGSRDAAMVAGGQMLRAGLRHAQVVVLPDVGHEPFIEARAQTVQTVRDFLLGQS